MTQENGLMVDYDKKYQGRSSAEGSNKKVVGWKVYTPEGRFVGLLDENKLAVWYVVEKSCTEFEEAIVDYSKWYVGNIYNPRNKTKMGKEIVKGFLLADEGDMEFMRVMTPDGQIKKVYNPIPFTAENASSCSERVDDERLFIANHNTAFSDKRIGPIIGFKLIGRRSGEYKGIVTLNGEFVRVDESTLRVFDGPYTAAQFYAE